MLLAAQSRAKAVVIGGGLLGLEAAAGFKSQRHGRHRPAPDADADGAPARPGGGLPPAAGAGSARHQDHHQGANEGDPRRAKRSRVVELGGRTASFRPTLVVMAAGIRPNAGARERRRSRGQSRHRRRCRHAHVRSRHLRARRMRGGGRPRLWPRRAALRDGARRRGASRRR